MSGFHHRPAFLDVDGWMWEFVEESGQWRQIPNQPVAFKNIAAIIGPDPDCPDCPGYAVYNVGAVGVDGRYWQQTIKISNGPLQVGPWEQLPVGPNPGSGFWFVD